MTEVSYKSFLFLELEDVLTNFPGSWPSIMDVKLGSRTFMEGEVRNSVMRGDLYKKLCGVDPDACSEEEHRVGAVTKLNYMLFR